MTKGAYAMARQSVRNSILSILNSRLRNQSSKAPPEKSSRTEIDSDEESDSSNDDQGYIPPLRNLQFPEPSCINIPEPVFMNWKPTAIRLVEKYGIELEFAIKLVIKAEQESLNSSTVRKEARSWLKRGWSRRADVIASRQRSAQRIKLSTVWRFVLDLDSSQHPSIKRKRTESDSKRTENDSNGIKIEHSRAKSCKSANAQILNNPEVSSQVINEPTQQVQPISEGMQENKGSATSTHGVQVQPDQDRSPAAELSDDDGTGGTIPSIDLSSQLYHAIRHFYTKPDSSQVSPALAKNSHLSNEHQNPGTSTDNKVDDVANNRVDEPSGTIRDEYKSRQREAVCQSSKEASRQNLFQSDSTDKELSDRLSKYSQLINSSQHFRYVNKYAAPNWNRASFREEMSAILSDTLSLLDSIDATDQNSFEAMAIRSPNIPH